LGSKGKLSFLLVALGLAAAGWEVYEFYSEQMPQLETQTQAVEADVATKQRELVRLKEFAQNIENVKRELTQLNVQLESALEHMPRTFNLSGLLRKLTMLAQNSGVELSTFKPKKAEQRQEGAFFNTITIDFDLRGSFTQCLVFLDQVTRLKRIVDIEQVGFVVPTETAASRSGATNLVARGTIRTYRFAE